MREEKFLSGFGLLTRKPICAVNLERDRPSRISRLKCPVVALQGKLGMEIAQLPPDDAAVFMSEYGITELSLNRMISISYDCLTSNPFLPW